MKTTITVLRTSGAEETHVLEADVWGSIKRLLACELVDTVVLGGGRVMLVDDEGWECERIKRAHGIELRPVRPRKPINAKATEIYRARTRPNDHQIAGDVAIVNDEDFAR